MSIIGFFDSFFHDDQSLESNRIYIFWIQQQQDSDESDQWKNNDDLKFFGMDNTDSYEMNHSNHFLKNNLVVVKNNHAENKFLRS